MAPEGKNCIGGNSATIADRVFLDIQRAIVEGQIPPGSKISEPELARTHGISRGPLREAMGRLESCGLVERRPNVGARGVRLSVVRLLEIYQVREALEGMPAGEVVELRRLLELHRQQLEREEGRAYFQKEGDLDFHYRIVLGSGNTRLIEILCNDLYHLVRLYRYQFGMASPRAPQAFREHTYIVDAIADGDHELAEILMRRHIRASRRNVEQRLHHPNSTAFRRDKETA